jgi:hypothetical protein
VPGTKGDVVGRSYGVMYNQRWTGPLVRLLVMNYGVSEKLEKFCRLAG